MAQKMTLTAYLAQRGTKAKALTKGEAELLGIPYPLQCGWPRKYGALEIDKGMLAQLATHADVARLVAEEKGRRAQVNPRTAGPALPGVQLPLSATPARVAVSPVPGFVLRQAKRYDSSKSRPRRKEQAVNKQ